LSAPRRCPYCQRLFVFSIYRPQQMVCSRPECQRQRRAEYHRQKLAADAVYREVVRESQKQWWEEHPGYQKQRRQRHPELVATNRRQQRQRDQQRRLQRLVRNNVALDLKGSATGVWLLGRQVSQLDRNNLASAQILIFQPLSGGVAASAGA
jgi:hypothetical protein